MNDAGRIRAILAALDRPLSVQGAGTPYPGASFEGGIYLIFTLSGKESVLFEYDPSAGTLTNLVDRAGPLTVTAPPDFLRALGLE